MTSLIGKTVHFLTVLGQTDKRRNGHVLWQCTCTCGNLIYTTRWILEHERIKSCGCKTVELIAKARTSHGETDSPTWKSWKSMMDRCYLITHKSFSKYGGRGILVCDRWHSYELFRQDMGERPSGTSIDRRDNDGDYTPENCEWQSARIQARNRSTNRLLTLNGRTLCVSEWADATGLPVSTIQKRLEKGWATDRALTQPRRNQKLHINQAQKETATC